MIAIRPARSADTPAMAVLLNQIIKAGGTTAMTTPVSAQELGAWMEDAQTNVAWHVAVNSDGDVVGFQWITLHDQLPPDTVDIATFVQRGQTGAGIGTQLFKATCACARQKGYAAITAVIRADNTQGLAYYTARGFKDHDRIKAVRLDNGQSVDKVVKRFWL